MNKSSHVKDAKWNESTQTMRVYFHGGEDYDFDNVTKEDHDSLHAAPSPGTFLRSWIIPRYGKGRRVQA